MGELDKPFLGDETKEAPVEEEEEDCADWHAPLADEEDPAMVGDLEAAGELTDEENRSVCVSVCALCAAVPALIGSWCWPILVGAIFGVVASNVPGGLVELFHGLQVAIMLALMTNIVQFAYWKQRGKANKRPIYVLILATVLILIQPTCMLVIGSYGLRNFFFDGGNTSSLVPNTAIGWCIQIFGTYLGFILMFWAVFEVTQLHHKLRSKWRAIRRAQGRAQ